MDPHKNFVYSTVATAPSPATTGTSLVIQAGDQAWWPDPAVVGAYNVEIYPVSATPTNANAEVVRVTAKSSATLTIVRAQEGSTARTVIVGDQIALAISTKVLTDVENLANIQAIGALR